MSKARGGLGCVVLYLKSAYITIERFQVMIRAESPTAI